MELGIHGFVKSILNIMKGDANLPNCSRIRCSCSYVRCGCLLGRWLHFN